MAEDRNYFSNEEEFNAFMREIDSEMRADGVPIPGREMNGFHRACRRLRANLRMMPLPDRGPRDGVYEDDDLSLRILGWFQAKYGNRLKIDFSPGTVPVLIEGDAYAIRLPRIYGQGHFFCDPAKH